MSQGRSWVDQILDAMEQGPGTGVDPTLIREQLRLTPTERLRRMQEFGDSLEEIARRARRLANPPRHP